MQRQESAQMYDVTTYLEAAQAEPHALLLEIEQHARKEEVPVVTRQVGRLLSVIVHAMQANRIVEIGTGFGYSTLWMALALPVAGRIWTFDPDMDRTSVASATLARAGVDDRVEIHTQDAIDVLHAFPQRNLDVFFVNAPRDRYEAYLEYAVAMLKLSGLAIFSDVLQPDRLTRFNRSFAMHPDLDATILPIGGGLAIGARRR